MVECKYCHKEMVLRNGKFGNFYFCPNQRHCGAKTISASDISTGNPGVDLILSLIPEYTKDELEQMYYEDEVRAQNGECMGWDDVWIGS